MERDGDEWRRNYCGGDRRRGKEMRMTGQGERSQGGEKKRKREKEGGDGERRREEKELLRKGKT